MTKSGWAALQQHLLLRYGDLKKRLTRALGSPDLAGDALHDTWLRLERGGELANVRSPDTYLLHVALNIARDNLRSEGRRVTISDAETLLGIADDAPDAERAAEGRSELRTLMAVMAELPPRQKAILMAARLDGLGRREIAERYGVSIRYVHRELEAAQEYCAERFEKLSAGGFTSVPRESSFEQDHPGTVDSVAKAPRGATTGAGIAALQATPDTPPSNVYLIAPRGTVDAGAAGVRVSGNLSIAALTVLNTANIQVQGTTTGIPTVQGPPVAALTSANNTAGAAQTAVAAPAPGNNEQPSVIIVEFLGFGGGDGDESRPQDGQQQNDRRRSLQQQGYDPNSAFHVIGNGQLTDEQMKGLTDREQTKLGAIAQ